MKQVPVLNHFPVFSALPDDICRSFAEAGRIKLFKALPAETIDGDSIFCILNGTAAVYSKSEVHPALIRYLNAGDIFGAAAVFKSGSRLSNVRAHTALSMLEVPSETVEFLLSEYPDFTRAYLRFLSDRIAFLNDRLSSVTAGSAEQRLMSWIAAISAGRDSFDLPVNMSSLAKLLDLGRASLYRAFDLLEEKALIERRGTTIMIKDHAALKLRSE